MAQSKSRPLDGIDLALRETDTAMPAPPAEVELEVDRERAAPPRLAGLGAAGELVARRHRSPRGDAWRRLIKNKLAVVGLAIVVFFVLIAVAAPLLAPYGQNEIVDVRLTREHPSWTWPFGLDANARDIYSRVILGARVSLFVGVLS